MTSEANADGPSTDESSKDKTLTLDPVNIPATDGKVAQTSDGTAQVQFSGLHFCLYRIH